MSDIGSWLPGVVSRLFDERDIQIELGHRLEAIDPRIRWEAGPCGDHGAYIAFSPNFHSDLLVVTEKLAKEMPPIEGWRIFGAKPRKEWTVRKILLNGTEYFLDAWRYRLVMFKGGEFFDVEFFSFDDSIDEKNGARLGVFLASSELGEKLFMRAIDRVNVSARPKVDESTIAVGSLYDQIIDLYRGELPDE